MRHAAGPQGQATGTETPLRRKSQAGAEAAAQRCAAPGRPRFPQKQRAGLGRWAGSRQVPVRPCTPGGQHTWEPLSSARGPSQAWKEQTEAGLERARLFLWEREKAFWASTALLLPNPHPPHSGGSTSPVSSSHQGPREQQGRLGPEGKKEGVCPR